MARKKAPEPVVIQENIVPSTLDDLMGDRFDIYAKDVIQDRAIPDARDGMKPVQRRIIYAMWKTGNTVDKPTKKCAHIVGEVMGKYHPHGNDSIYEALVRMSQTWRVRAPLIDFQGNNGSMDGDGPAAYRYTEARLAALSQELIRDIEKDTVDMGLTFDDTEFEPTVLPARFPNLFVNGSSGIAIGMATEIPPHNLVEISNAIIYRIQHPSCPIESLMRFVPGPDFPTGGIIYESQGLSDIYLTGRGRIDVVSKVEITQNEDGDNQIIVTEIPYGVNKAALVHAIDKLRHERTIAGISEVRDESDKSGLRIAIDIKEGFKPESILAYLMQKTQLRSSYSANMVSIVNGRPLTLNLMSYCDTYIAHQVDVITRRCNFDLSRDLSRLEIVEGLIKASSVIDEIVHIIQRSKDKADSKANIQKAFGFTDRQSEAIVMMPLYKLSHFDVAIVEKEKEELDKEIAYLREILSSPAKLNGIIVSDLRSICKKYGDERRTQICQEDESLKTVNKIDLVAKETVMVAISRDGYVKRSSLASWRSSNGPKGALPGLKDGDSLIFNGQADTTDHMVVFTSKGNYLYFPIHVMKSNKWNDEGVHVNYVINLPADEKLVRAFAVRAFRDDLFFALVSKKGQIKRTRLSSYPLTRYTRPVRAMRLLGDDEVVSVVLTSGNSDLLLLSADGLAVLYNENEISPSSTTSAGVKAASFKGSLVADMLAIEEERQEKIALLDDHAHVRMFSTSNIKKTGRLKPATVVFRCFKSEPHKLLFSEVVGEKEAPFSYSVVLSSGERVAIEVSDTYLTPMEKYAKGGNIRLEKGKLVALVDRSDASLITSETVSHIDQAPIPEEEEDAASPEVEERPVSEVVEKEDDRPSEKYEQISIFGADDVDI